MKWLNYFLAAFLFFLLILVRKYESDLFYDPFLSFFKTDFRNAEFPDYETNKLILNISFRYLINTVLSLGIIYFLFKKWKYLKFSVLVFLFLFIVLTGFYVWFIKTEFAFGFTAGFYVRRFLIQPIILLILIPAFYFMENNTSESK